MTSPRTAKKERGSEDERGREIDKGSDRTEKGVRVKEKESEKARARRERERERERASVRASERKSEKLYTSLSVCCSMMQLQQCVAVRYNVLQ